MALENANLCSPTVLDRINSLVEPSRSITVIVEESSLVIHPPQILCILLTINPRHGEVSKAMCNKGVEIFMIRPYWALDDVSRSPGIVGVKDLKRFINLSMSWLLT